MDPKPGGTVIHINEGVNDVSLDIRVGVKFHY